MKPVTAITVGRETDPFPYVRAVEMAGGAARVLVAGAASPGLPGDVQALVIAGGAAVHPSRFGQDFDSNIKRAVEEPRDELEWAALSEALARKLPVLGICRGAQLISVYFGGTLTQHLAGKFGADLHRSYGPRDGIVHNVTAEAGRLRELLGDAPVPVNSIHRQGIDKLGEGLTATVRSEEGLVEGFEAAGRDIIAVQWHPEELAVGHPRQLALFEDLMSRARSAAATDV